MPESCPRIRLLAMDVDGTLTDGTFSYGAGGTEGQTFHARDGLVIKCLPGVGIEPALISGRASEAVRRRAAELGIQVVHLGVGDKLAVLRTLAAERDLPLDATGFVGDDLSDLAAMRAAGWSAAPADAVPEILETADFVARRGGGRGAVREVLEHLLRSEGLWDRVLARFGRIPSREPSR